jgi:hypothetical protein
MRFCKGHHKGCAPLADRFWRKVNKHGPMPNPESIREWPEIEGMQCWEWTGTTDKGYGRIYVKAVNELCPRVAYFLDKGKWPTLLICHKCDNPRCVRLSHLFEGTHKTNAQDRDAKGRGSNISGSKVVWSKLTDAEVNQIRTLLQHGEYHGTQRQLAQQYHVSDNIISSVKLMKTYKTEVLTQ